MIMRYYNITTYGQSGRGRLLLPLLPTRTPSMWQQNILNSSIFLIALPYFVFFSLLIYLPVVNAGCRNEQSRSCEAICRNKDIINNNNNNDNKRAIIHGATVISNDCTIRALLLLPDDDTYVASLDSVLPILRVAEQKIHEAQLIPSYIRFEWMPQDDKCDAAYAVIKAMDGIVKDCAHIVFGPVCDYPLAAVGRITKYFNSHGTPLISIGGSTYDFEKKKTDCADEFYMLLRTGILSFETLSHLTVAIMKSNNWTRSIFFYERDGQKNVAGLHTCFLMLKSLAKQMRNENMTFSQYPINTIVTNRSEEMKREIGNKHSSM